MKSLMSKYRKVCVFIMDLFIMAACAVILFLASPLGNGTGHRDLTPLIINLAIWFCCIILFNILFHTYDSLWRYAEGYEYLYLLLGFCCGTALYLLCTAVFVKRQLAGLYMISVLGSSLTLMLLVRIIYRIHRRRSCARKRSNSPMHRTGIIGAGDAGAGLLKEMLVRDHFPYEPVAVFDDDPAKIGMRIMSIQIKGPIAAIPDYVAEENITDLILAIPSLSGQERSRILNICTQTGCKLHILPDRVKELDVRTSMLSQLRNVRVEDLLGREPIKLAGEGVSEMIEGSTVLITGGGGSIGSEICRQVAAMAPKKLVIVDNYENTTYELQQDLKRKYGDALDMSVEIATIQDSRLIDEIFDRYRPDLVFHAAAHKHVPLMEASPAEAVSNNVFGTWNVIRAADKYGVKKFVQISTDKAVNPTNIMGATKRICELMLASMKSASRTDFVVVRFGNVLGSNGSVIPLFTKQIEEGGPVTITDKRIIRYFMTISEAVSLVLQAGAMADKSQVYVLDMGKPVKILDLAEKLIQLSGFEPYTEIPIEEVGLRPGEKLFEELLVGSGHQEKTSHSLIFVEEEKTVTPKEVSDMLHGLDIAVKSGSRMELFEAVHRYIPEFKAPDEVNSCVVIDKVLEPAAVSY
jgi:FlaA1/EpsC-like NDP-sugar epimerase